MQQIAQELAHGDFRTRRGKEFDATAVRRLLLRHAAPRH
ncbi:hypothetical protein [Hymenobacter sp. UYP22]